MKIVLDIDGVLADFTLGVTTKMSALNPDFAPVRSPQQPSWDFREAPPGLFKQAFALASADAFNFNANLESLLNQKEINRLQSLVFNNEVYFVTNRPGGNDAIRGTKFFLESRFGLDDTNVILAARKGEFAAAIGATHLIDDKAGNAVFTAYHSPATKVFLLDALYNQFDQTVVGTKVTRVKTFTEFLDAVEK